MSDHMKPRSMASTHPTRRPKASAEDLFALIALLHYSPTAALSDLSQALDLSTSTVKRLIGQLRRRGILRARASGVTLSMFPLVSASSPFCGAVVGIEPDIERLRGLGHSKAKAAYATEEGLLNHMCNVLPRTKDYEGAVLVERGHIVMGASDMGMLITLYAVSTRVLFDFVRLAVEKADGVVRTRTMMIAHSCTAGQTPPNGPSR